MKLCIILSSPLKDYYQKGEVKLRYYNPLDIFDEVHFIEFTDKPSDPRFFQSTVGRAKLKIHSFHPLTVGSIPGILYRLTRILRSLNPDIIRAYDPSLRGAIAVTIGKRIGRPVAISVHTNFDDKRRLEGWQFRHIIEQAMERYTFLRANGVFCVSDHVINYVRFMGAHQPQLLYNRVDSERFSPPQKNLSRWPRNNPPVVLSIGRLILTKNLSCLVKAVAPLQVVLKIVGAGPEKSRIETLARRLKIADRLVLIDRIPHNHIHEIYHRADIFALPTLLEGFCIPVVEAMASGLPVVVSTIPVLKEIGGDVVIRARPTPDGFMNAIKWLLDHPEIALEKARRGVVEARKFDSFIWEKREAELYLELLNSKKNYARAI